MITDLKNKTEKDMLGLLTEKRLALHNFIWNTEGGKSKNVKEGREIRKDIARILTEMRFRKQK